ncbi:MULTISPECIES: flagellar biosynthesis regulator FlaF [Rhodomicrobium]|uniref:flagellar biosynthesis regulator FlaF n=1 Tax=Rhodomicrobium TaxID=1068 RepID=UPI000B4C1B53|nr:MULTISPECIES: flagellar biosynthesis regulator FlaF [Rhodomicrobium]
MYRFSYAEVFDANPPTARQRERIAIEHSIERLRAAMAEGSGSPEAIEAAHLVRELWTLRIDDLARPGHDLARPESAELIAVGRWIVQEAEAVGIGRPANFQALIEVSQLIARGMEQREP